MKADEPYVPVLGNKANINFQPQFSGKIDGRSLASTPIEYLSMTGEKMSQHASGFFYKHDDRVFLVSARHAIAGLDAFSGRPIASSGYLPHEIKVFPYVHQGVFGQRQELSLRVRDASGEPLWLQDPEFEELKTDIACVEILSDFVPQIQCLDISHDENLLSNVGMECFVVGYPNKNYHQPFLPVWRRGALAYEPTMPVDDKPLFLVDAMTSSGMSGSAIFQRWHGPAPLVDGNGDATVQLEKIVTTRFVGVYGGRLANQFQMAEIGYGWYANRIPLILNAA